MSIVLDLPPDLECKLASAAEEHGLSLADYVVQLLNHGATDRQAKSGADVVAYWQSEGVIGTRPDIADSSAHARAIRRAADISRHPTNR